MAIITERVGDVFSAPPNSIIIHACNARGSWGAGVALAFKKKYPAADRIYHTHCTTTPSKDTKLATHQASLVGTTLLIPPVESKGKLGRERHWIACLFTSVGYGRNVSKPEVILENTRRAVKDLGTQVETLREKQPGNKKNDEDHKGETGAEKPGDCWAVRINSGLFSVPWAQTKKVLEEGGVDIVVVRPEDEDEDEDEDDNDNDNGNDVEAKTGEKRAAVDEIGVGRNIADKKKSTTKKGGTKRPAPVLAGSAKRRKKRRGLKG